MINRRQAIQKTALFGAAVAVGSSFGPAPTLAAEAAATPFTLPPLPYAPDALEPHIDAQTMTIHHDRHHATYVTNLNTAVTSTPALAGKSIEALLKDLNAVPEAVRTAVRNQGGGHANHAMFWLSLKKNDGRGPTTELAAAMDKKFGSFDKFKTEFTDKATKQFGSGWAWLSLDAGKELVVESTPNQDTPLSSGRTPLLGIDVWEHAYYLKYQNKRADYIAAFYNVINWDVVAERYKKAIA